MVGPRLFWWIAISGAVLDLASKSLVFGWVGNSSQQSHVVIPEFFEIRGVTNPGGIWGIGGEWTAGFAVIRFLALFVILYLHKVTRPAKRAFVVGLGLILGGAIGNLWDTVFLGAVRDFLEFDLHFMIWPTFNLADAFITSGAFLLFFHFFLGREKPGEGDNAGILDS